MNRIMIIAALLGGLTSGAWADEPASPTLLVLSKDENTLDFLGPDGKVFARVPTGATPHEVIASDDGRLAFVSNYGTTEPAEQGRSLSVIDVAARKELRRVDLGPLRRPHGLAFAGGKLYFTVEESMAFARYDPAADKLDWLQGTGQRRSHMIHVARDGRRIITANINSDTLTVFEPAPPGTGGWSPTVIPVGKGPEGFDVSPDGMQLWAAGSGDGKVAIIDLASKAVVGSIPIGTVRSNRLKFTPDGSKALVSDFGNGDLYVLDVPGRAVTKKLNVGRTASGILVVPDGSRAFVAASGDNRVAEVDLEMLAITRTIPVGANPDGMAYVEAKPAR